MRRYHIALLVLVLGVAISGLTFADSFEEIYLGLSTSQFGNGSYTETDDLGYVNLWSSSAIGTGSFDLDIGYTYYWSLSGSIWWGTGLTATIPVSTSSNTENTALATSAGSQNGFGSPFVLSADSPLRFALTPNLAITLTPSFLTVFVSGPLFNSSTASDTYIGIGGSGTIGLADYFSPNVGFSVNIGYRYIRAWNNNYEFISGDSLYQTYWNSGIFGIAGLVFRF